MYNKNIYSNFIDNSSIIHFIYILVSTVFELARLLCSSRASSVSLSHTLADSCKAYTLKHLNKTQAAFDCCYRFAPS